MSEIYRARELYKKFNIKSPLVIDLIVNAIDLIDASDCKQSKLHAIEFWSRVSKEIESFADVINCPCCGINMIDKT